jgi:hypothetical protein
MILFVFLTSYINLSAKPGFYGVVDGIICTGAGVYYFLLGLPNPNKSSIRLSL